MNKFEDGSPNSNNRNSMRNEYDGEHGYNSKLNRSFDKLSEAGKEELRERRGQREVFPFRIFIKDEYLKEGISSRILIDEII